MVNIHAVTLSEVILGITLNLLNFTPLISLLIIAARAY
jgi:hypothetical protein